MTATTSLQDWVGEVSTDSLLETNRNIAQWVRETGTDDERKAFNYIDQTLSGYGLTTQIFEPTCLVSLPVSASLEIDGAAHECITHAFSTMTPSKGVAGELVYAGAGTEPELAGADARGRIAIIEGLATPQKAAAASQVGVRALICISGEPVHEMIVSGVWGSPTPSTLDLLPTVPVISVDLATGEQLKELAKAGSTRARVATVVDTGWRPIPVLVADLDVDERDYVMFSGHVDSWHYGAMDNASANATMMEVARIAALHRDELRRGLKFAFWSGHSHARYAGSTWFADAFWFDLREHCVAHVNVDSTGGIDASDLSTANSMAETYELAKEVIQSQTGQELLYQRFGRAGDQSFWGVGLPALFMSLSSQSEAVDGGADMVRLTGGTSARGGGLGWWWHTTEDTMDKIDPANLKRDTAIYVEVVGRLLCDPIIPLDVRGPVTEMLTELDDIEALWIDLPSNGPADLCDFGSLREALQAVRARADAMHDQMTGSQVNSQDAERISAAIVNACKELMPVNYTLNGEFDHDLALGARSLPTLRPLGSLSAMSDSEQWASVHGLRRALNRVRAHVIKADRALAAAG